MRLRGAEVRARAEECEAMMGVRVVAMTSQKVLSDAWEMSTIMPRRFISATTCLPNRVRPLWWWTFSSSMSPEESAQLLVLDQVRVM